MNIIFGDSINVIPDRYITLELDTFCQPGKPNTITAHCLVEKLAVEEYATMEHYKKIHADVIKYYKQRQWDYCEQAISRLTGHWSGELDSFYQDLLERISQYRQNEPPPDWNGVRLKNSI